MTQYQRRIPVNTAQKLVFVALGTFAAFALTGCGVKLKDREVAPESGPAATQPAPETITEFPPLLPQPTTPKQDGPLQFLHAEGRRIVDPQGREVALRGCNVGGWLLLEPWMAGLDGQEGIETEKDIWDLMEKRFGRDSKLSLIKTFREKFFDESDVERIAAFGMNCVRLPIWWRMTDDPDYGGDITLLDRAIQWCSKNGVYVILDLQGAPGGQARESANVGEPAGEGNLWKDPANKDRTVQWWKQIAERYKDEPAIAAYDLLNEGTATPKYGDLAELYDRLYKEIRTIDTRHILIMEDVWGFHHLPRAEKMGWENVVYSFHYYPRDITLEQKLEAPDVDIPRYNRTALYKGVPIYVGEFSAIDARTGGADLFLKLREAYDYFGWAWTFWSYKKIEENDNVLWGLYGYYDRMPRVDLHRDSLETIRSTFESFATTNSRMHPLMPAALLAPSRWKPDPAPADGSVPLSLRDAYVMAREKGYLRYEWGVTPPNIGYWTKGDTCAWKVLVPAAGNYDLVLDMANGSDRNQMALWVDGVHVREAKLPHLGGWRRFTEHAVATLALTAGHHVIEIAQADDEKGFINLRGGMLRPAAAPAPARDENSLLLKAVNMERPRQESSIHVEWLNDPPNIGSWNAGDFVVWKVNLEQGGRYNLRASYSTPNADSTLRILIDDQLALEKPLGPTGDWGKYDVLDCGSLALGPGEHTITARWDVPRATAAGNMRQLRFDRNL